MFSGEGTLLVRLLTGDYALKRDPSAAGGQPACLPAGGLCPSYTQPLINQKQGRPPFHC
jgi:hypothetical protein